MTTLVPRPSASLYVGGLASDVTEATLFEIFNQVGPVASIRVCRDTITRRSLGYAYVNFHNVVDAERALDTLNYSSIKGRQCRIMWSQRDPTLRRSGLGNIFIKNLDKTIDNKSLHDTFSTFGNILSCRVMVDESGNSRGFGFVHFENSESAESAIAKVNGMLLNGKKAYVGHHISKRERQPNVDAMKKNFTNVFVKNVDENLSDDEFKQMFDKFGTITSVAVMRDESGKSRGFGFVNFSSHEEANLACDEMNENELSSGKKLFVGRAQKKAERKEELQRKYETIRNERLSKYQGVNLYIKNLDDNINDEKLRGEFAPFGTITSAKIQTDERNHSRGFGFVCFATPDEASKAIAEMNGRMFGSKPIYVALAQRKELRRQQLEAQHAHRAHFRMQQGVMGNMYQPIFYNPVGNMGNMGMGMGNPRIGMGGAGVAPNQQGFVYPPMIPRGGRWTPGGNPGGNPGNPQGQPQVPQGGQGGNPNPGQSDMGYGGVMGGRPPRKRPVGGPGQGGQQGGQQGQQGQPGQGQQLGQNRVQNLNPNAPNGNVANGNMIQQNRGAGSAQGGPGVVANNQGKYRYNQNVRNRPEGQHQIQYQQQHLQQQQHHLQQQHHQQQHLQQQHLQQQNHQEALTPSLLASASPEEQKNMLGERLFLQIQGKAGPSASKVTGMLLEMDNGELLHLLETPESLNVKVEEALAVLQNHNFSENQEE